MKWKKSTLIEVLALNQILNIKRIKLSVKFKYVF